MSNAASEMVQLVDKNVDQVKEAIKHIIEFANAEIPEVLNQLLLWHGIKSGLFFILGIGLIFTTYKLVMMIINARTKAMKEQKSNSISCYDGDLHENAALFIMAATFTGTTGILITLFNFEWLQILIAPKLYLIEYGVQLIK